MRYNNRLINIIVIEYINKANHLNISLFTNFRINLIVPIKICYNFLGVLINS